MNSSYKDNLQRQLESICSALEKTNTLGNILDNEWCETISKEINGFEEGSDFSSNSALMFFQLKHPLRGIEWFENAQEHIFHNRVDKLTPKEKLAISWCGLDPLKVFLPNCDDNLLALQTLSFKSEIIKKKFTQLKNRRFNSDFRNYLFELLVLGFFAKKEILTDIEPEDNMVDGVLNIDNRKILLEVTFSTKEILNDQPGVYSGDVDALIEQVIYKTRKKVDDDHQLALAVDEPTILVLGLNRLGADNTAAKIGLEECFDDPDFSKLSGVIVSDSWKFMTTRFLEAKNPEITLSPLELKTFNSMFNL